MDDTDSLVPGVKNWLVENKWHAVIGLFGLFLCLVGVSQWWNLQKIGQESVLVVETEEKEVGQVVVDVSGAVVNPGVYKINGNSRLGEVIEEAGGLKEGANTVWISKTLNLAQPVKDGMKIYIPFDTEAETNADDQQGAQSVVVLDDSNGSKLININVASQSELESLWGIGESRAKTIIDSRPYENIEQIIDKAGVPLSVFEKISEQISVY